MKYAVKCEGHGIPGIPSCGVVQLTEKQYIDQMDRPDSTWFCPRCRAPAEWVGDDDGTDDVPEADRRFATDPILRHRAGSRRKEDKSGS